MSTKLNPVVVTESTVGDAAFDGVRRRPVVAINDNGELVVCCRRTAAKHGWKVESTLHQRTRAGKKVAAAPEAPAADPVKPVAKKTTGKKALKLNLTADAGPLLSVEDLLK